MKTLQIAALFLLTLFSVGVYAAPKDDFVAAINACAAAFPDTTDPARWACTQSAQAVFLAAVLSEPAQAPVKK